ncbi:MAG: winged helix-turn-helix domain-containing protein, partial [Kangiellaceae bacterium]|nr:winged helix-turn-helix domain-containing protein [Kangiellaceae bacterium]
MNSESYQTLVVNQWQIDMETGELLNNNLSGHPNSQSDRIDPLGIKLLELLAVNKGELVAKDTIMTHLWPDTVVTDDALARCVSRVRKLLGDTPKQPTFIETLPKRGYRLIASTVEWAEKTSPDSVSVVGQYNAIEPTAVGNRTEYSSVTEDQLARKMKVIPVHLTSSIVLLVLILSLVFFGEELFNETEESPDSLGQP